MVYSSGASAVFTHAKIILPPSTSTGSLASRKIETSDPNELGEAYLIAELGLDLGGDPEPGSGAATPREEEKKAFARPKGPGRRR